MQSGSSVAGLWSFALQALAGRAAHEINNALNGALVNLEVVKARARPGADGGAIASFASVASEQVEQTATLVGALVSLARAPRGSSDAAAILRDALALLAPAVVHDHVRIAAAGLRSCPVGGDPTATRLAIVASLLAVSSAAAHVMLESAESIAADDHMVNIWCTMRAEDGPVLELAPSYGAVLPDDVIRALAGSGVFVSADSELLRLALPAPDAP